MSFYVPNYKFIPAYKNRVWDGKINLYNLNTKEIYAGLYEYIKAFAESDGRGYNVELIEDSVYGLPGGTQENVDLSFIEDIPLSSKNESIRPRDYQLDAVEHALKKKSCLLLSPTASGKSLIIYLLARWYLDNHDGRILIVVPTTSLVEQMYTDFADYANQDDSFSVEDTCQKIYGGKEKTAQVKYKITTENDKVFTFYGNEYIKLINSNVEWILVKDITDKDEIDDTWLQGHSG